MPVAPVADVVGSMSDSPEGSIGKLVHALGAVTSATGTTIAAAGAFAAVAGAPAGGIGAAPGLGVAGVGTITSILGNVVMGVGGAISAFEVPEPGSEQSVSSRAFSGFWAGIIGQEWTGRIVPEW
jgi:hypothetical protein